MPNPMRVSIRVTMASGIELVKDRHARHSSVHPELGRARWVECTAPQRPQKLAGASSTRGYPNQGREEKLDVRPRLRG